MAGLPVMLSDIPVYREVGGDAALYFDPHDLGSIAAAMVRGTTDHTFLDELVVRGSERRQFSWDGAARERSHIRKALGRAAIRARSAPRNAATRLSSRPSNASRSIASSIGKW